MVTTLLEAALRDLVAGMSGSHPLYTMIEYHLGWRDPDLQPVAGAAGKRIRGVLTLLCAEAAGGSAASAATVAAAVELVHNLSLIYDDIQDGSPYRRGRPTVWRLWGVPQALNAAAALQAMVSRALATPAHAEAQAYLQTTVQTLCEGQYDDLALAAGALAPAVDAYLTMIGKKTGALLGAAAYLGARAGGAPPPRAAAFRQFGHRLGVAYQLVDDVRGIWGAPGDEKPAADLDARKRTLPVLLALEGAPAWLRAAYRTGQGWDAAAAAALRAHLEAAGTGTRTLAWARAEAAAAAAALAAAEPAPGAGARLRELLAAVLGAAAPDPRTLS